MWWTSLFCRWLPGSKQFQLPKNPHDPYPQLYLVFDHADLLNSLAVLLGALAAVQNGTLISEMKNLVECMLACGHGLNYMASHPRATATIARSLIQVGSGTHCYCMRYCFIINFPLMRLMYVLYCIASFVYIITIINIYIVSLFTHSLGKMDEKRVMMTTSYTSWGWKSYTYSMLCSS